MTNKLERSLPNQVDFQKKNISYNISLRQALLKNNITDYVQRYKTIIEMLKDYENRMIAYGSAFVAETDVSAMLAELEHKAKVQSAKPWAYKDYIIVGAESNPKKKYSIIASFEKRCLQELLHLGFSTVDVHTQQNRIDIKAYKNDTQFEFGCHGKPHDIVCSGERFRDAMAHCIRAIGHICTVDVHLDLATYYQNNGYTIIQLNKASKSSPNDPMSLIKGTVEKDNVSFDIKLRYDSTQHDLHTRSTAANSGNIQFPDFDSMDGHEFEHFCAQILAKSGFEKVSVTQGSSDQGIDIIAYRDDVKYGFQCKCYSSPIGNHAVQEVFAGKTFYQCHVGVVLTNNYFTRSAIELAKRNGVVLWNRDKLVKMLQGN